MVFTFFSCHFVGGLGLEIHDIFKGHTQCLVAGQAEQHQKSDKMLWKKSKLHLGQTFKRQQSTAGFPFSPCNTRSSIIIIIIIINHQAHRRSPTAVQPRLARRIHGIFQAEGATEHFMTLQLKRGGFWWGGKVGFCRCSQTIGGVSGKLKLYILYIYIQM